MNGVTREMVNNPAEPRHEGDTGREKEETPAGEKSKRGRPAGSRNTKKPCSQIENRNVVEGGGGGRRRQ